MVFFASPAFALVEVKDTEVEGVTTWYAEDATLPIVQVVLTFAGAGSASDPEAMAGRAVMAANLLTEGAGDMNALAFHKAMESKALTVSASADRDDLTVSIHTLKDHLPEAVRLATLALTETRFDADALATAKAEQVAGIRAMMESPNAIARRAWSAKLYGTHPYARDGMGTIESVERLSAADLSAYRARYITSANVTIAAAGDIDRGALKDIVGPLIEALPEEFFPERDMPGATLDGKGETIRIPHAGPQSVVVFGGPGISRADKRYYAAYLMNNALGGGSLSSRLMRDVRTKQGMAYSIGTVLANGDAADSFFGQFATRNDSVDQAIAATKAAAAELVTAGLSARECEEVKNEVKASFTLRLDSTARIADIIAMMMRYDLGRDYMKEREALFDRVACSDIQAAAKQLLTPEKWLFVVVGGGRAPQTVPVASSVPATVDTQAPTAGAE